MRTQFTLLVSLAHVLVLFSAGALAQTRCESLPQGLARARQLLSNGQTKEGLDLLDACASEAAKIESENLDLRENLLYEAASSNLDFAQVLENPAQYHIYAERARQHWLDYIRWFGQLSPADVKKLTRNRIEKATAFLGIADIRLEDFRKLFEDYANIPKASFLGQDAIERWKTTLYTCPDWRPVSSEQRADPRLRQKKICTDTCTDDWQVYAATLDEWARTFYLKAAVRESKLREAQQIKQIAEHCPQP